MLLEIMEGHDSRLSLQTSVSGSLRQTVFRAHTVVLFVSLGHGLLFLDCLAVGWGVSLCSHQR